MESAPLEEKEIHRIAQILCAEPFAVIKQEEIFGELGLSSSELIELKRKITVDGTGSFEFFRNTLLLYKTKACGTQRTVTDVIACLRELRLNSAADTICQQYGPVSNSKPIWFDVREPVASFTGREVQLGSLHKSLCRNDGVSTSTLITKSTALFGLGGIGKSELARRYAQENYHHYGGNFIWINADSLESNRSSLAQLATAHFKVTQEKVNSLSDQDIFKLAFEHFAKQKWLLIFDNVEDLDIFKLLPNKLSPCVMKPNILITSRTSRWRPGVDVLPLGVLTLPEAIEFFKTWLTVSSNSDDDITKLATALQCLPLALQQALSYINCEMTEVTSPILKYVEMLESVRAKDLLEYKDDEMSDYETTAFTTWTVTMNKIQSTKKFGPLSIRLINVMSCFAPDAIPLQVFEKLKLSQPPSSESQQSTSELTSCSDETEYEYEPIENVSNAVALLKKYSMVTGDPGVIDIHRVVQRVVSLKARSTIKLILNEGFELLHRSLTTNPSAHTSFKKSLLPHAESVWRMAVSFNDLMISFADFPSTVCAELEYYGRYEAMLQLARDARSVLGKVLEQNDERTLRLARFEVIALYRMDDHQESLDIAKETYKVVKESLGDEHYLTISMSNAIGMNLQELGKFDEALILYEDLLAAQLAKNGLEHPFTLSILHNKSIVLFFLGRLDESRALFESVYEMREKVLGHDDPENLRSLSWIAKVMVKAEDIQQAVVKYEEVYERRKHVLGEEHPDTVFTLKQLNMCKEKARDIVKE